LSIERNAATVSVSWITPETGLILEETSTLGAPSPWSNSVETVSVTGLTNAVQQPIANGITHRFYRLRRP
jgi:hypothetical protein